MENAFPKRKHPRLKNYDYSQNGYYFVTICASNRRCVFGTHQNVGRGLAPTENAHQPVGRGLAPAENTHHPVGREPAPAAQNNRIVLTPRGEIAKQQLAALEKRYDFVRVDQYVIMPNHIHMILVLEGKAGASPRPTLSDILCAYKSLTTRTCNVAFNTPGEKLFQTSFYEKVIRSDEGYFAACQYISENPRKWKNDEYYK